MIIENKPEFSSTVGDELSKNIQHVKNVCIMFDCEATLSHNGKTHTISKYVDIEELTKNWFKGK